MELSIDEVGSRVMEAAAAAERGERVFIMQDGRVIVEIVSPRKEPGIDFDKVAAVRKQLGLDGISVTLGPEFDDPAYSRQVLGLDD